MTVTSEQIQQKVVEFAKKNIGKKVGSGECFDLADQALTEAGGKTASDYGKITADADYVWGELTSTAGAQAGDILQFRNYESKVTTTTKVKVTHQSNLVLEYSYTRTQSLTRPHHTAVVTKSGAKQLEVLEQNVERGTKGVKEKTVGAATIQHANETSTQSSTKQITINTAWGNQVKKHFAPKDGPQIDKLVKHYNNKSAKEETTTTVKKEVKGTVKAYRPKPK